MSDRSMMRAMCEVQFKDGKRLKDLMMFGVWISWLWHTVFVGMVMC